MSGIWSHVCMFFILGEKLTSPSYLCSFAKMTFLQRILKRERDQNKVPHSQDQNIMPFNAF